MHLFSTPYPVTWCWEPRIGHSGSVDPTGIGQHDRSELLTLPPRRPVVNYFAGRLVGRDEPTVVRDL